MENYLQRKRWIIEKLLTVQAMDNRKTIDSAHAIVYNVITEDVAGISVNSEKEKMK